MKVIDLKEYKNQKALEKQIDELDRIGEQQYHLMSPLDQQGYHNFMRLLKALDAQYGKPSPKGE